MALGINARMVAFVPHTLALVLSVMVLYWSISYRGGFAWESTNKRLIFNLHPPLMLIGLVILGGEAIISHKWLQLEKPVKKKIHLVLHAIALILGIWGICAAFKNHNESNIPNLYSLHSWIGIGVIVIYVLQWLYSFIVFFYPRGSTPLRSNLLPWHVFLGLFVYVLAVGNTALGFLEKLTFMETSGLDKFGSEAFLINFMAIITILFGTFVILIVSATPAPSSDDVEDNYSYSALITYLP
ncbi:hypothetical protein CARUB_v10027027mg [Capsella rubella]|uniref:ascorbate ferrireductase (transmembrane) n=1 Tax=Capsella rubella TaxID=81985 RepID=R0EU48_9BRAS|nr:transmembrane ascorbate ferrireductase 1 [Capsella rubella]EOA12587.1 hypothetical protein CARUB_v10027027mg [Capsella rubella]